MAQRSHPSGRVSAGLQAVPRRCEASVPARLAAIDRARRNAALATDAGGFHRVTTWRPAP